MITRTGEIERGNCDFCAREADFFIKSFKTDKEFYLCGNCFIKTQKIYESLTNIFLNDKEHQS